MNRRNIVIFIVVAIIILLGIGVFNALRQAAAPKSTPSPSPSPAPAAVSTLDFLNTDTVEARFTIEGRVVAKENHVDETISISQTRRTLYFVSGYSGTADPNNTFDNNQPAYEAFMRALYYYGFTYVKPLGKNAPKPADSEVGLCPTGQRYVYEIIKDGQPVYRAWSTSCNDPTTFGGTPGSIKALFQAQIPDYNRLTSGLTP